MISFRSLVRNRRFASIIVSVASLCIVTINLNSLNFSGESRDLSVALKNGGCFVLPAQEVGPDVKPVFAASFPGSGARMTWNLIEALTGLVTGDEWYNNGRIKDVVSVKTHWPHPTNGRELDWADEIERAFLLFRNPMNAIPSFHNFIYENERKIPHHTQRAPTDIWIHWRNNNFNNQLRYWKDHFEYWMDKYPQDKRIVVPYEHLVDPIQGPLVTQELNAFLGEGPGVDPIANASVPCVWGTVVHYQKGNKVPNTRYPLPKNMTFVGSYPIWPASHRKGSKERPYTKEQYDLMISTIEELRAKYNSEGGRVSASLEMYVHEIEVSAKKALEKAEAEAAEKKSKKDSSEENKSETKKVESSEVAVKK